MIKVGTPVALLVEKGQNWKDVEDLPKEKEVQKEEKKDEKKEAAKKEEVMRKEEVKRNFMKRKKSFYLNREGEEW